MLAKLRHLYGKDLRKNTILQVLVILVLLIILSLTVRLLHHEQDIRQDAQELTESPVTHSYSEQVDNGNLPPTSKILEIALTYNASASPILSITQIVKKNGYTPVYPPIEGAYKLQLLNSRTLVVYEVPFELPITLHGVPPEPGKEGQVVQQEKPVLEGAVALTVPAVEGAQTIRILSPTGSRITQKSLAGIPEISNVPDFQTRYGDDIQSDPNIPTSASPSPSPRAQPTSLKGVPMHRFFATISRLLPDISFPPQVSACHKKGHGNDCNKKDNNKNNNNNNTNNKKNNNNRRKQCNKKADCRKFQNSPYCSREGNCVECNDNKHCSHDRVCSNHQCVTKKKARAIERKTDGYLDIAFIGDDYTREQMPLFYSHVNQMAAHLLTYEPFKSRASQIRIHYVNNTKDLHCHTHPEPGKERVPICNKNYNKTYNDVSYINGLVNDAAVPYDEIIVAWNTTAYGGVAVGNNVAIVASNNVWSKETFVHELGHTFGHLADEYIADYPVSEPGINCSRTKPNPAWKGIVTPGEYFLGCGQTGWYRPSPQSVMLHLNERYFNRVSQIQLNAVLDRVTGTTVALAPSAPAQPLSLNCIPLSTTIFNPFHTQIYKTFLVSPNGTGVPGGVIMWTSTSPRITFSPATGRSITNALGEVIMQATITKNLSTSAGIQDIITAQLGEISELTANSLRCHSSIQYIPSTPTPAASLSAFTN